MNQEALHELRLGEIKNAFAIVSADVAARVAKAMPGTFDAITQSMPSRRVELATGLIVFADELKKEADAILASAKAAQT